MDASELIKQVKLRLAIWSASHKDQNKMASAWHKICKIAWPDFDKLPGPDKRTKCLDLQKKWKGLQQSFTRDYLRQKQGRERGVQKNQYYDQLTFLIPGIDKKGASGPNKGPRENRSGGSSIGETTSLDITPSVSSSVTNDHDRDAEEDRQFLLSLVSFMQDVPRARKLELRTEILQVVAKYTTNTECVSVRAAAMSQEY